MQGRTRGTLRPSEEVGDDGILSDGFVARLADHIFENPAMSGGLFVMALTAAAIVSNAMMMQNGHHPDPLFMTRPGVASRAPVPLPRTRVAEPAKPPVPVPVPAPRQAPAAQPAATPVAAAVADETVIADVQRALAGRRLYRGAADGIAGPHTRAAIAAYEKSAGLPVTGTASADLLARLRGQGKQVVAAKPLLPAAKVAAPSAAAAPAAPSAASAVQTAAAAAPPTFPAPARQAIEAISATPEAATPPPPASSPAAVARQAAEPVATPPAEEPVPTAADVAPDADAVDEAAPSAPEAAAPPPPQAPPAAPPAASAAHAAVAAPVAAAPVAAAPVADAPPPPLPETSNGDRLRYRKIQNALNQAGYGPLKADGMASEQTTSAIRRFELDNGLPITGKPSERVTARLVSIGAMDAN